MKLGDTYKTEERWAWLDEDGEICSPIHESLAAAMNFGIHWQPHKVRMQGGSWYKTKPHTLTKLRLDWIIDTSPLVDSFNKAFEEDRRNAAS